MAWSPRGRPLPPSPRLWRDKHESGNPGLIASTPLVSSECRAMRGRRLGSNLILTSTNLAIPASDRRINATNRFESGGNFSFTNPADPAEPQLFYKLRLQ